MNLPVSASLPINKLAASFANTSATYKFYWLLAIIESVGLGKQCIPKRELFARMVAGAWYTVNYFHISFGKQDLLQQAIETIKEIEKLTVDLRKDAIVDHLATSGNNKTNNILWHFNKNVPHWFLSPWFSKYSGETDSHYRLRIQNSSRSYEEQCLYALFDEHIEINPDWKDYLRTNAKILKDFCHWNLSLFLQVRNPSVPDIPGKLIKPPFRSSLTSQRKHYWDVVFNELGNIECIFTNTRLDISSYALDHFIPHAFVSHDLIWNLIPIEKSFNSKKSDKLPSMELHFEKFIALQQQAYDIVRQHTPRNRYFDEFLNIFPGLGNSGLELQQYKDVIMPLHTIAGNNGFTSL